MLDAKQWRRASEINNKKALPFVTFRQYLAERSAECECSETPFLDASILLASSMGLSRSQLLAMLPDNLPETIRAGKSNNFEEYWTRRCRGESVATILGRKEFYGRDFRINNFVLSPRPDTEILVEATLEIGDDLERSGFDLYVHDLCTGSGIVAVTVALERRSWKVSASDISTSALNIARQNIDSIAGFEIPLFQADLLEGIHGHFDIIAANPPYVSQEETDRLLAKGWKEPRLAFDGGIDGFEIIRQLVPQARSKLRPGGFLLIETDPLQSAQTCDILKHEGFCECRIWKDLAGRARVTGARCP
jgi:release factor glutamine methyltransferase